VLDGGSTVNSLDLNGATVSGQRLYKLRWKKGREDDAGRCRGVVYLVYPVRLQPSRPTSEYAQPPRLSLHLVDLRHDHVDSTRQKRNNLAISRIRMAVETMPSAKTDDAVDVSWIYRDCATTLPWRCVYFCHSNIDCSRRTQPQLPAAHRLLSHTRHTLPG